jgi:hypothetical protein
VCHLLQISFRSGSCEWSPKHVFSFDNCPNVVTIPCMLSVSSNFMKLTTWDVIFSTVVTFNSLLTQFLIPRVVVIWNKRKALLAMFVSPMWKGISKKFKHTGHCYNIRTIINTKHTLRSLVRRMRPERDWQLMLHCVYSILGNVAEATLAKQADC